MDANSEFDQGDQTVAAIKAVNAAHTQLSINIGTDFKYAYFPVLSPEFTIGRPEADLCSIKVDCWTNYCPSFIRYNKEAREWQYNKNDEGPDGDQANKIYTLYVVTY